VYCEACVAFAKQYTESVFPAIAILPKGASIHHIVHTCVYSLQTEIFEIRPVAKGGPKGAVPPAKSECPLANVNGLTKNFGLRNVSVCVKMIELRVHVKSNLFTTNDC
jgi:hypothetical protein